MWKQAGEQQDNTYLYKREQGCRHMSNNTQQWEAALFYATINLPSLQVKPSSKALRKFCYMAGLKLRVQHHLIGPMRHLGAAEPVGGPFWAFM